MEENNKESPSPGLIDTTPLLTTPATNLASPLTTSNRFAILSDDDLDSAPETAPENSPSFGSSSPPLSASAWAGRKREKKKKKSRAKIEPSGDCFAVNSSSSFLASSISYSSSFSSSPPSFGSSSPPLSASAWTGRKREKKKKKSRAKIEPSGDCFAAFSQLLLLPSCLLHLCPSLSAFLSDSFSFSSPLL